MSKELPIDGVADIDIKSTSKIGGGVHVGLVLYLA